MSIEEHSWLGIVQEHKCRFFYSFTKDSKKLWAELEHFHHEFWFSSQGSKYFMDE